MPSIYLSGEVRLKPDQGQHTLNNAPCSPGKPLRGYFLLGGSPALLGCPSLQEEGQLWAAVSWGSGPARLPPCSLEDVVTEGSGRGALSSILLRPVLGAGGLLTDGWKSLFPKGSERLAGSPLGREAGQFQLSLSTSQALCHLTEYAPIPCQVPWPSENCHYPHCTDEETKAQKGQGTCSGSLGK